MKVSFLNCKFVIWMILAVFLWPVVGVVAHNGEEGHAQELSSLSATIYYNEACGMCAQYVQVDLPAMFKAQGVTELIVKDYINDTGVRPEMNLLMNQLGVPLVLRSHIMTFVGDKYILAGHIPQHIVDDLFDLKNSERFQRIIVYQDEMHGEALNYKVWAIPANADNYVGSAQTYDINESVTVYLDYLEANRDQLVSGSGQSGLNDHWKLLPIILVSGFLDGINPCAFAVLLFFISFLFSLRRTKAAIWQMGIVYIGAIYLAYLLIGFGIMKAIMFSNSPHFMAQLGAWLVITLGVINIIGHFFPRFPIKLRIPHASKATIERWVHKATLPAAFILGFLVGLCTFPCSGGIYVAIIGLLAVKTTYMTGLSYLLLYNLMFILPLVIILLLSANKYSVEKISRWEKSESKGMKLLAGIVMITLGLIILIFFT